MFYIYKRSMIHFLSEINIVNLWFFKVKTVAIGQNELDK